MISDHVKKTKLKALAAEGDAEAAKKLKEHILATGSKEEIEALREEENEQLKQKAQQGDVEASYQLGERYRSKGDLGEAKKWLEIATAKGHGEAKRILADIAAEQAKKQHLIEMDGFCLTCEKWCSTFSSLNGFEAILNKAEATSKLCLHQSILHGHYKKNVYTEGLCGCSSWERHHLLK
jgi:TPR repeat protein